MLNHVTNKMYFGTPLEEVDVTGYEVWWASPLGLFERREEAIAPAMAARTHPGRVDGVLSPGIRRAFGRGPRGTLALLGTPVALGTAAPVRPREWSHERARSAECLLHGLGWRRRVEDH